jgi:hypothetical protein
MNKIDIKTLDYCIAAEIMNETTQHLSDLDIIRAVENCIVTDYFAPRQAKWYAVVRFFETIFELENVYDSRFDFAQNLWYTRFNKNYQHDIESLILNFKKPAYKYSSDLQASLAVAEKVDLFSHIILTKNNNEEYEAYALGIAYVSPKDSSTFIENSLISRSKSLSEVLCVASLTVKRRQNGDTYASNQSCNREITKTG